MKLLSILSTALLAVTLMVAPAFAQKQSEADFVNKTFYPAVVLLYSQDFSGGMAMRCTATAIEKNATGYVFVTAAHCASADNALAQSVVPEDRTFFYITPDEPTAKTFLPAKLIECGYQHAGDDFCLFQVDTKEAFPIVPIGVDPTVLGEGVINVASPIGLGKQLLHGNVSSLKLNRDVRANDINWTGVVMLQLPGTDGGSSGSAIVCENQQAICAFLVGTIGQTQTIAMPVSRLTQMRADYAAKKYKYAPKANVGTPDTATAPDDTGSMGLVK